MGSETETRRRILKKPYMIRIRTGKEIGIFKEVLRVLNCPPSISFLWGEDEKVLLISAADEGQEGSIHIPESHYNRRCGVRIINEKLMKIIDSLTGWKKGSQHKISGEYILEIDMVAFRIDDAM
jgi:hypothetical protein